MQIYLGIDMGGSGVKIIAADENKKIIAKSTYPSDESLDTLNFHAKKLLSESRLSADDIKKVCITGVGSSIIGDTFLGARVSRLSEFECFAKGAQMLSGKNKAVVVSMGTGTAFVRADNAIVTHLGGSGVGGGTLSGLCELILGEHDNSVINQKISRGNTSNVDLTIGDIWKINAALSADVTAANFGKKHLTRENAADDDIAAGLCNMIFQTTAVMAAFLCNGTDIDTAVFVGSMAEIPEGRQMIEAVGKLHNTKFIVADNPAYAGAFGAVLLDK